jgi:CheY-like chemotaxis protein
VRMFSSATRLRRFCLSTPCTCGIVLGVPSVPSVMQLRQKVQGWLHREPKVVVPRTILVVDGNTASRESTARLVESLGISAVQTASLAEALVQLHDHDPEFVLLGFELDDATGLDALRKIRDLDSDLPVVMLAPDLWDRRVAEAMRQGAIAYLARPFGQDDLRELLVRP